MNKLTCMPFVRRSHENNAVLINHDPSDASSCLVKTECGHVYTLDNITKSFDGKKLRDRRCSRCNKLALPLRVLKGRPDENNPYCLSPALDAACKGDTKILRLLLQSQPELALANLRNPQDESEITLLYAAASHGQVSAVKLLLEYGSDVGATERFGAERGFYTPLIIALVNGHHDVVEILASDKTAVNSPDSSSGHLYYLPPLVMAKDLKSAQILVNNKADVNATACGGDAHSATPLFFAAQKGNASMVKFLVQHGANVNAVISNNPGKNGVTPLFSAALEGNASIVEYLLLHGAHVDAVTEVDAEDIGLTPLLIASKNGHTQVVRVLLKYGANANGMVHSEQQRGLTSLIFAAMYGNLKIVKLLLKNNANVNAVITSGEFEGYTALCFAAKNGHGRVAEILLKNNADVNVVQKNGKSAFDNAVENKHLTIAKLLQMHGAKEKLGSYMVRPALQGKVFHHD
ncbi:ankyrin repeat domain-containing protein, partial [Endozoicomonas sp. ONNA2]|uniref:ankyrin repeat domain-containing protein n=1 Tax=Endozoicomonas sp. ONNA2 TaxID=2828741 RepID=UPI00214810A6